MLQRKHRGAHSELVACAWLLNQGYEVFRNVSPHGIADIIAFRGGEMRRIDVKSVYVGKHPPHLNDSQLESGVIPLYVYSDGNCVLDEKPEPRFMKRVCEECGAPFTFHRRNQKRFCSNICRRQRMYRAREEKRCLTSKAVKST